MRGSNGTARRRRQSSQRHPHSNGQRTGDDRLALTRDFELLDLVNGLDAAYDTLLAQAADDGGDGIYEHAASIKAATDYLFNLRFTTPR
jgi:hypothetical protein